MVGSGIKLDMVGNQVNDIDCIENEAKFSMDVIAGHKFL